MVRNSNSEVKVLRAGANNTLHLALMITGNTTTAGIMDGLSYLIMPIREGFGKSIVMMKTRNRCEVLEGNRLGQGRRRKYGIVVNQMVDVSFFKRCRFLDAGQYTNTDTTEVHADIEVATTVLMTGVSIIGQRLLGHLAVMKSLPMRFASLLSTDVDESMMCLEELRV